MSRVRYLEALASAPERRHTPLLRPPRRLFPHEPPPVEPLPLTPSLPQPSAEVGAEPPPSGEPSATLGPVALEPARRPDIPAPLPVGLEVEQEVEAGREPAEAAPRPPRRVEIVRAPKASRRPEARTAARTADPPPPGPREETVAEPNPARRSPVRAVPTRRSAATLAPSRLRPPTASPPERAAPASRPAATTAPTPSLHIGSIEVTVAPSPAAHREPALAAPPSPVYRPPAPFDARSASTTRWFGLAQR